MKKLQTRRMFLAALAGLAVLGAGSASYRFAASRGMPTSESERPKGLLWPQARPLPSVDLVDQDGNPFRTDDFRGHWSLVFFGYTSCPDICPMTLAVLNQMHRRLAGYDPGAGSLRTVLVSVDPERDTPERLRDYVLYFNEGFWGLTGDPETLQVLTRALGAAYLHEDPDAAGEYLVHHNVSLFLIDPEARLAGVLTSPHEPADLADRLREMLDYIGVHS